MTTEHSRRWSSAASLRIAAKLARRRSLLQPCLDAFVWSASIVVATLLRYEFEPHLVRWPHLVAVMLVASCTQIVAGLAIGLYRSRWRFGSFEEVAALVEVVLITGLVTWAVNLVILHHGIPSSATLAATALALLGAGAVRYVWRLELEYLRRPRGDQAERTIVFGAGEGGVQVVDAMLHDPSSPYLPVVLLDDDPAKQHFRIRHVKVVGTRDDIAHVARRYDATVMVIAIAAADAELLRDLVERGHRVGLDVRTLPPVQDLFALPIGVADIRPITEEDLLGRRKIDTEVESIAGYLAGRRVLVTGAGGSIGAELCRQVMRFAPEQLLMVDRDESALHQIFVSLFGRPPAADPNVVVCDIRDRDAICNVFATQRPDVVFHAAALKHVPLLQQWPAEAVKTNIIGTHNVLTAAVAVGVRRFVNISTDKAADPINVLGYTKRVAEGMTATLGSRAAGEYLSVRFGNVLGSRGSVLPLFHAQVRAGGPITVTHPDVTRYFMTIEEAVQLVVQAGALGRSGEVMVLDMGEPVRIADVARRLAATAERKVEIVYTGLRPGEKLHECLYAMGERVRRIRHPLIAHVDVAPIELSSLAPLTAGLDGERLVSALANCCNAWSVNGNGNGDGWHPSAAGNASANGDRRRPSAAENGNGVRIGQDQSTHMRR